MDTPSETDHGDEAPERMQVQGAVGHPHWAPPGALLRTGPCKPHPWAGVGGACLPRLMGAALMGVAPRLCGQNSLPPASASPPCGTDRQAPAALWPLGPLEPERSEALSIDLRGQGRTLRTLERPESSGERGHRAVRVSWEPPEPGQSRGRPHHTGSPSG